MIDLKSPLIVEGLFDAQTLLASRDWQPLTEGVFISAIYEEGASGARAAFLHYLPGAAVPLHLHAGIEHILILQGAQHDGDRIYKKGDLVIHGLDSRHQLSSPEGCLALGIWERPVSFIE